MDRQAGARLLAVLALAVAWTAAPARAAAATPAVLELATVPVLPGAHLEVGGVRFFTDAEGNATIDLPDVAEGLPRLTVIDDASERTDQEIRFSRWWGVAAHGKDRIRAKAVFDIYQRVTWSYAEEDGRVVEPSSVSKLVVRSSHGNVHDFEQPRPVWLHAVRVVPSVGGLTAKEIDYRVESVLVDGAEVVIRGQQRFTPAREPDWRIKLLFFNARFSAFDAVTGWPLTRGIRIEYPSKRVVHHELDARGELTLRLPRGTYRALVEAPGMRVWTPVALSRDQAIPIKVLTYMDMALGALTGTAIALGLLLIGRPHLVLRRPGRRVEAAGEALATAAPPAGPEGAAALTESALRRVAPVATFTQPSGGSAAPSGGATTHTRSGRRPVPRPRVARAVAPAAADGLLCPNGCPPSASGARFCRHCGTPRIGRRAAVPTAAPAAAPAPVVTTAAPSQAATSNAVPGRRPVPRPRVARAVAAAGADGPLCPKGCRPSSPGAQFCRYCGTPRIRRGASAPTPMPAAPRAPATTPAARPAPFVTTATRVKLSEGGHG